MTPNFAPRDTMRARALRNTVPPAERRLWQYLSRSQLGGHKFSRQIPIGPYFCDFVCRRGKLVVEVDGQSHDHTQPEDARRTRFLESRGFRVLRFSNADVLSNVEGVVTHIARCLASGPTPDPSRKREGS